jgi:hypothetical protein
MGFFRFLFFSLSVKRAATTNVVGSHDRHSWHSEQRCVEQLIRRRDESDYTPLAFNVHDHGPNDPNNYTVWLHDYDFHGVSSSGLSKTVNEDRRKQQERERKEKEDALAAKIEAGRLLLEYQKAEAKKIQLQLNSKNAIRHHRTRGKAKGQGATLEEWDGRLRRSTVTNEYEEWQERRDNETGAYFYHCTNTGIPERNQWDPPVHWPFELPAPEAKESPKKVPHPHASRSAYFI